MISSIKREIPLEELATLIPSLISGRHKGQNGKIGVIGGSFEYTGAPYYGAAAVLRGGGDLSHIFCTEKAATPIKSYSPEIIVHPYLLSEDELRRSATKEEIQNSIKSITKWYDPIHGAVIGSGLGRDIAITQCIEDLYSQLAHRVTVCDGDFFWFLSEVNRESLAENIRKRSRVTVLTPNKVEFKRLWKFLKGDANQTPEEDIQKEIESLSSNEARILEVPISNPLVKDQAEIAENLHNVNIIGKGEVDVVTNGKEAYIVRKSGCYKRCGGQGDVLGGLTALYSYWDYLAQQEKGISPEKESFSLLRGCMLASYVTRDAAARAYEKYIYGTTTPHILDEVHNAINTVHQKGLIHKTKL